MSTSQATLRDSLKRLEGLRIAEVEFVEDYFQLVARDFRLTILSAASLLQSEGDVAGPLGPETMSVLQRLVGRLIEQTQVNEQRVELTFSDGLRLYVPIAEVDGLTEHFILLDGAGTTWIV